MPSNTGSTSQPKPHNSPSLPPPFAWAGHRFPTRVPNRLLTSILNRFFAAPLASGELDWLRQKTVCVIFQDAGVSWRISSDCPGTLTSRSHDSTADVTIAGLVYDFLCLATRSEDPDTLFFQRRLRLDGDVELGLMLKNFLDGFEPTTVQRRALDLLQRLQRGIDAVRSTG